MKLLVLLTITTTLACSIQTDVESKFAIRKKTEVDNSADGAKTATGINYFPLAVGNKWVFSANSNLLKDTRIAFAVKQSGNPSEHVCAEPHCFNDTTGGISLAPLTDLLLLEQYSSYRNRRGHWVDRKNSTGNMYYGKYFVASDNHTVKLYKALFNEAYNVQTIVPAVSSPATMFPSSMQVGDKWQIEADCFRGHPRGDCQHKKKFEVVAIEDIETDAGHFKDCVKIKIESKTELAKPMWLPTREQSWDYYRIYAEEIHLWLAPNIGPVKVTVPAKFTGGVTFSWKLISYTAQLPSVLAELPPDPQPAVIKPQRQPRTGANYFPLDIGNRWVFLTEWLRADGTKDSTTSSYTIEDVGKLGNFRFKDRLTKGGFINNRKLLRIRQRKLMRIDGGDWYFVSGGQGVKFAAALLGVAGPNYFLLADGDKEEHMLFPQFPQLGEVKSSGEPRMIGNGDMRTFFYYFYRFEVFGVEDVVTPAGEFKDCVKLLLVEKAVPAAPTDSRLYRTNYSFLWLAPDVGPVMSKSTSNYDTHTKLTEYNVQ